MTYSERSIIILDMARNHMQITEETRNQTTARRIAKIIEFLTSNNIQMPDDVDSFSELKVVRAPSFSKAKCSTANLKG